MAEEKPASKPVVRRVVKKTAAAAPPPTMRYGRPANSEVVVDDQMRAAETVSSRIAAQADPTVAAHDDTAPRSWSKRPIRSIREFSSAVANFFSTTATTVSDSVVLGTHRLRSSRLPHLAPVPAALITGVVSGLIAAVLGLGALHLFAWLRGVATGGGTWGTLTFVVVAFIAFVIGELLLSGFKTPNPRLTSFLGVVITIVAMLCLYIDQSDTRWAFLLVPSIGATSFTLAHWLMAAADSSSLSPE